MAPLTQWTCVWANSGRQWRTGKPGILYSMGSQRVGHDWVTEQHQEQLRLLPPAIFITVFITSLDTNIHIIVQCWCKDAAATHPSSVGFPLEEKSPLSHGDVLSIPAPCWWAPPSPWGPKAKTAVGSWSSTFQHCGLSGCSPEVLSWQVLWKMVGHTYCHIRISLQFSLVKGKLQTVIKRGRGGVREGCCCCG